MKSKIIYLLLFISFGAKAYIGDLTLQDITLLSQKNEIPYEEGIKALLALPDIFFAKEFEYIENPEEELRKLKNQYNGIHNRLFILTHIARIQHQISTEVTYRHFRPKKEMAATRELMTRLEIKRDQIQALKQALEVISTSDFDHSQHQFNSLSDLGKINTEKLTDTEGVVVDTLPPNFSSSFSKSFSKSISKGYASNPFLTSPYSFTLNEPLGSTEMGEEDVAALIRELSRGNFVFRYQSAQALDMFYREDTSLPEEAVFFLNRLGIKKPSPYSAQKDLSFLYRTAPPSQARSNACVGFALAADIEFELRRKGQITQSETVSPYSVYATLRYREEGIKTPDCEELQNLSHTIAEGTWAMDIGIYTDNFSGTNFCLTSAAGDTTNQTGYISIKSMEIYDGKVTVALLKAMIDHKKPPILLIDSDAREEIEDWMSITDRGQYRHTFVIVGYGTEDIDPFTLVKGPYFLVRDSLTSQPVIYKISARNLLDHSLAILKTSRLERD